MATEVESIFIDVAKVKAFRKLYKYITGNNEAGETINVWVRLMVSEREMNVFMNVMQTI